MKSSPTSLLFVLFFTFLVARGIFAEDHSAGVNSDWAVWLAKQDTHPPKNLVPFIQKCLLDLSIIKVDMKRSEIEKRFPYFEWQKTISPSRFAHPDCRFFVVHVVFACKTNPIDNKPIGSPDDKAIRVSKPYIESPWWDKPPSEKPGWD